MIPKLAIEKAMAGGWDYRGGDMVFWQSTALDPLFWQALGKELGWRVVEEGRPGSDAVAHKFFDLILTNQSTDTFWQELLGHSSKKE